MTSSLPPAYRPAPKISVIIPTYNRGALLPIAIESVFRQTYLDYELIVVDDGSTDDTRERLLPSIDRIRYFYQPNRGVSAARNAGVKLAQGQWISMLDSDDVWHPTKLRRQMDALAKLGNGFGACFTDCNFAGDPSIRSTAFESAGLATDAEVGPLPNPLRYMVGERYAICIQSLLFLRSLYHDVGGCDEALGLNEDRALVFKLSFKTAFCYVSAPLVTIDRTPKTARLTNLCSRREAQTYAWGELMFKQMLAWPELTDLEIRRNIQDDLTGFYYDWTASWLNGLDPANAWKNIRKIHGMGQSYRRIFRILLSRAAGKLLRMLRHLRQLGANAKR